MDNVRSIAVGRADRYTTVAIALHWMIAVSILALMVAGVWMVDAIKKPETRALAFDVYQWHKSLGLTVLVLTIVRIAWRLANPPPPLPEAMPILHRRLAAVTHVVFYALMLMIPLAGWAMVSASKFGLPTIVFGLFEWPHVPGVAEHVDKAAIEAWTKAAHKAMAYGLGVLLVLHVGAALKHHVVDRDDVLARMLPFVRRRS